VEVPKLRNKLPLPHISKDSGDVKQWGARRMEIVRES
jgi:hypothetical protein